MRFRSHKYSLVASDDLSDWARRNSLACLARAELSASHR